MPMVKSGETGLCPSRQTIFTLSRREKIREQFDEYYKKAKAVSDNGGLNVVDEIIMEIRRGHVFELKKGQVARFEVIDIPMTCVGYSFY